MQIRERLAAASLVLVQIAMTPLMDAQEKLETLMALYQQGDTSAATELIHSVSPRLYRFFAVQVLSRAEADDLLQETWLRIHRVRHTYRPSEPALAWFYAIARNVRVDHYRRAMRTTAKERELKETMDLPNPAASPVQDLGLEALLAPLSSGEREVVQMLKVEGLSLEEIARATSSTVGSVKQKAHRAYRKLRQAFGLSEKKAEAPR